MSLSTLLEAAKYLDYLDSSNNQRPNHQQPQLFASGQTQSSAKKPARRQRSSKKDAANTMVAMSLPTTSGPIHMQGLPIPHASGASHHHQATSLSSSFATDSPLSSFASTALLCSKASEVASASSSAASSLSSSDSSSSCGEILMGDNDFNRSPTPKTGSSSSSGHGRSKAKNAKHNYHKSHRKLESGLQHQFLGHHQYIATSPNNQSIARYIAATSAGPQLVTMTSSYATSAPVDGHIRAGHVIHAANAGAILSATNTPTGSSFDPKYFSTIAGDGNIGYHHQSGLDRGGAFNLSATSFGSEDQLSGSAPSGSCPPLIMARVQPMILNSISPSAQSIMAFQPASASSPTSSSSSYSRHRELHKTLEKNRRAHLRHCFEILKAELPTSECADKKTSHINIIKSAIRYVLALREQESEIENELQRLTKIKSELTENLSKMRSVQQQQQSEQQQQVYPSPSNNNNNNDQSEFESKEVLQQQRQQQLQQPSLANSQAQQPVAEQQLSFLLSQSKLD